MDEAKVIRVPEIAERLKVKDSSVGDLIRIGTIPEPFNWPQKKNWIWIRSEFDAWDEKRKQGLTSDMAPAPVTPKDYWPLVDDVPYTGKIKWHGITPLVINGKRVILEEMEVDQSCLIEGTSYEESHPAIFDLAAKLWIVPKMSNEGKNLRVWRVA